MTSNINFVLMKKVAQHKIRLTKKIESNASDMTTASTLDVNAILKYYTCRKLGASTVWYLLVVFAKPSA